jgi:hypothetical protein
VLAAFLPAAEGGFDRARLPLRRYDFFARQTVPWDALPSWLSEPTQDTPVIKEFQNAFYLAFVAFGLGPRAPQEALAPAADDDADGSGGHLAMQYRKALESEVDKSIHGRDLRRQVAETAGPLYQARDLAIRGQADEAMHSLLAARQQHYRTLARGAPPEDAAVAAWVKGLRAAMTDLKKAHAAGRSAELNQALDRVKAMLSKAEPIQDYLDRYLAGAMLPEITYQVALARHEEAERARGADAAERKEKWQAAERWWDSFLTESAAADARLAREAATATEKTRTDELARARARLAARADQARRLKAEARKQLGA